MSIQVDEHIKALIFDCDGTLADSMPLHYQTWSSTLSKYDLGFSEERFYSLGGVPTAEIVRMLATEKGLTVDAEKIAAEKDRLYHEVDDQVQGRPEVLSVIEKFKGIKPMAVASGSQRWSVIRTLKHLDIESRFDAIVSCEDVVRAKPDPEIFLKASDLLKTAPRECMVFEDTDFGIQAARDAGMCYFDVRCL